MIKGIIIFEQGGVQTIGEIMSYAGILATISQIVPQMQEAEKNRLAKNLSDDDLRILLSERLRAMEMIDDSSLQNDNGASKHKTRK